MEWPYHILHFVNNKKANILIKIVENDNLPKEIFPSFMHTAQKLQDYYLPLDVLVSQY